MSTDYTQVELPQQAKLIDATAGMAPSLQAAAKLWEDAGAQLEKSSSSLNSQIGELSIAWPDSAGMAVTYSATQSKSTMDDWHASITASGVSPLLKQAAALIPGTQQVVHQNLELYLAVQNMVASQQVAMAEAELQYQQAAGQAMNTLGALFDQATQALQPLQSNPQWSGPAGGGPAGGSDAGGGGASDGGAGADGGAQSAAASAGGGDSAAPGDTPGDDATGGADVPPPPGDPSLAGGAGTAPTLPPPVSLPPLTPLAPVPSNLAGTVPFLPPPVGLGGLGGVGGLGGLGGVKGGRVSVPGVSVAGGPKRIPQASAPVEASSGPVPNGPEPVAAAETPGTLNPEGSNAGGMPMMPMGGGMMGAGGAGGRPGSGAAERSAGGRGKVATPPGLPAALRGKAGRGGRDTFSALSRPTRRDRTEELPPTVQLLDEDLWRVTPPQPL